MDMKQTRDEGYRDNQGVLMMTFNKPAHFFNKNQVRLAATLWMAAAVFCHTPANAADTKAAEKTATPTEKTATTEKTTEAAITEEFKEGVHYTRLQDNPVKPLEIVPVIEFFSYGCPHCFHLEPIVRSWQDTKATYTTFTRMPAFWNEYFELLAQGFYTAEILNITDKIHEPLFKAIHELHQNFQSRLAIKAFFIAQGVSEEQFEKTFDSFTVKQKVKMVDVQFQKYKMRGVPAFVVGGVYSTSPTQAGSAENVPKVINFLAKKLHQGN